MRRVFLIVLDSFGIGNSPDAGDFGDQGANTLATIRKSPSFSCENLARLGLFHIDGVEGEGSKEVPEGIYGRLTETSRGKDTTIGHWEIAGLLSPDPLPVYPEGFPEEVLEQLRQATGRDILCNKPYSGTEVIRDYGEEHMHTGKLIVYTSADSVLQIAAHEEIVPVETLYAYCEAARKIMTGRHGVGRIIARPFIGNAPDFTRTANRHDYSLLPPGETMLDILQKNGYDTYGIGKIYDIFSGQGIAHTERIKNNTDGMEKTIRMLDQEFRGICFVNLVDFDMVYGHRNDIHGYAKAIAEFDGQLGEFLARMREEDILMITADHGCDPGYPGTDHTRERVPFLAYGKQLKQNVNLGTRTSFADIAATILDLFSIENREENTIGGTSFRKEMGL